ncbi:hypothetical protein F0562_032837 [Nyssa sinensis]|uniref:Uncharacterized protein n=1 Tax=Nyssa sinensis TaxID=561372 RepID=A0A5J5AT74_9ASTE|nr:hypothetical protein F0562_032837 [Nyssa sinensis]
MNFDKTRNEVAGLKSKMDKVSTFEKVFVEKISELENKLRNDENDLRKKDRIILELEAQLEAAKINNNCKAQIEDLQKTLSAKEMVIQNLISEKKALHFEVGSLGIILKKIQDTVTSMNEEDKRAFSTILGGEKEGATIREKENDRIEDAIQNINDNSPYKASGRSTAENTASPLCQEYNSVNTHLHENCNFDPCVSEFACSPPQPPCSGPQSAANILSNSVTEAKDNCKALVYQPDSESSTTQAETSKDPG